MANDPFERFERSRSGWLIPVMLFFLGAVPTALAIRAMNELDVPVEAQDGEVQDGEIRDGDIQDAEAGNLQPHQPDSVREQEAVPNRSEAVWILREQESVRT